MAGRYSAIPAIPQEGLSQVQFLLLDSLKQNVELLAGIRGEPDGRSRAVIRDDLKIENIGEQELIQLSAEGRGVQISGQNVPTLEDYGKLLNDVQQLANDLFNTRAGILALIRQLKGISQ